MSASRAVLRRSPLLFCTVARTRQRSRRTVVSRRADLTVEGYPRSGNSSFVAALSLAFPDLVVASHVHDSAHVARSRRLGRPTVVLARGPLEAVASTLVFHGDASPEAARRQLDLWVDFYRAVIALDGIEVVAFTEVADDIVGAMRWVGRTLVDREPVLAPDFDDRVRAVVESMNRAAQGGLVTRLGVPSPERRGATQEARAVLGTAAMGDRVDRAQELYASLATRFADLTEERRGQPRQ